MHDFSKPITEFKLRMNARMQTAHMYLIHKGEKMDDTSIINDFNNFITVIIRSEAYSSVCREIYGVPIKQMNMCNKSQYETLLHEAEETIKKFQHIKSIPNILDLGCGTGAFLNELVCKHNVEGLGIDFVTTAMTDIRMNKHKNVQFQSLNIDNLNSLKGTFSLILAIDSLFLIKDINKTIEVLFSKCKAGGKIIIAASEYGFDSRAQALIDKGETCIDSALRHNHISYRAIDTTQEECDYWQTMVQIITKYQTAFEHEGTLALFESRIEEAAGCLPLIKNGKSKRKIYIAEKNT